MKSLASIKKFAFVSLSSLVLALGLFAAPAAFAKENGDRGDHRGDRREHREDRGDRRERDRHEGNREDRGDREGRWDWDGGNGEMGE